MDLGWERVQEIESRLLVEVASEELSFGVVGRWESKW